MNLIEINRLTECRKKLDKINPECVLEQTELNRVKAILDDILEFKMFPDLPDYCRFNPQE